MTSPSLVIGADIGGSHITAAQADMANKQLITSSLVRLPVNSMAPADEIIATWACCIKQAMQQQRFEKICLAMPGPFEYEAGISRISDQNKYPLLYGLNVKELLAPVLEVAPGNIHLHNDAACFLQGEVFSGHVSSDQPVIGVTLGTGLGTAVYDKGIARSADRWNTPFLDGMAEDYLSTRWFVKQYAAITGKQLSGVRELAAQALPGNPVNGLFVEFGKNLAAFLNLFINETGATAVVIGGNIARSFPLFKKALQTGMENRYANVFITTSALGELAAVLGAAGFCSERPGIL